MRINPYELHINDPEYYDVLYVSGSVRRTAKWPWQAKMYGQGSATVATPGHEEHRMRRAALNPFFSKQSVNRLEPVVQTVVDNLLSRLEGIKGTGRIVNLVDAFTALTGDVICQYSFDRTFGMLDDPDFAPEWHRYMMDGKLLMSILH